MTYGPNAYRASQEAGIDPEEKYKAAQQARQRGELKNQNFGLNLQGAWNSVSHRFFKGKGQVSTKGFGGGLGEAAGEAIGFGLQNLGDIGGGILRGMNEGKQALAAAAQAGALADAQNETARDSIVSQAGAAADSLNTGFRGQAGQLQDAAIGQANAFEGGMQGISMSGIEGSDNMERNLQYGKNRGEAEAQLAFDIMGQQGDALQRDMAYSFDQLSQRKAGAMSNAFTGSLNAARDSYLQTQADQHAEEMANFVNEQDAAAGQLAAIEAGNFDEAGDKQTPDGQGGDDNEIIAWLDQNHKGVNGQGWAASLDNGSLTPKWSKAEISRVAAMNKGKGKGW